MKYIKVLLTTIVLMMIMAFSAFAADSYSDCWKKLDDGTWAVQKADDNLVTNAWVCDDAVAANGRNVWYLIDQNGKMITAGLVQDGTGNFYSIETDHNGYFGMLRYKSGVYDGIYLELEPTHGGSFGAIKNQDGIEALKAKYGLTSVANINNNNAVYTSAITASKTNSDTSNSYWNTDDEEDAVTVTDDKVYKSKNGTVYYDGERIGSYIIENGEKRLLTNQEVWDDLVLPDVPCSFEGFNARNYRHTIDITAFDVTNVQDNPIGIEVDFYIEAVNTSDKQGTVGVNIVFYDDDHEELSRLYLPLGDMPNVPSSDRLGWRTQRSVKYIEFEPGDHSNRL